MAYIIECRIAFSANKPITAEIRPDSSVAAAIDVIRSLKIPTDNSVVPQPLQDAAAQFHGEIGKMVAKVIATTLCRPVEIALKPRPGPCPEADYYWLSAITVGGLWPTVNQNGRIVIIDQTCFGFAQDQSKHFPRFVRNLLDLASERKPIPSQGELTKAAVKHIGDIKGASNAHSKLMLARALQQPRRN